MGHGGGWGRSGGAWEVWGGTWRCCEGIWGGPLTGVLAGWQVLLFLFFACAGLYFTLQVPVGLDQELAMPKVGGWLWGYPRPRLQGVTGARGWGHAGTAWSSTRMHGVVWLL